MSCHTLCQCQLSWPLDTQVSKRDPVNSEKAWLDFAVRLLSREVVGRGRGQETVWSERCKPVWWDKQVGLPWKNPTSNPKDTKDILQKKYTELAKYLSQDGKFPKVLEEEAKLWNEGKIKELFLLTTLTSLLGKVTGLHCAVVDACHQVEIMKAGVNNSLLRDIKQCLNATLKATENFKVSNSHPNVLPGKENNATHSKHRRVEPSSNNPPEITNLSLKKILVSPKYKKADDVAPNHTSNLQTESINHSSDPIKREEILAVAEKILGKRRNQSVNTCTKIRRKLVEKILPKPQESLPINLPLLYGPTTFSLVNGNVCLSMASNNVLKVVSPISHVQITDPKSTRPFSNIHSINSLNPIHFDSSNVHDVSQSRQDNLLNGDRGGSLSIHYSSSESTNALGIPDSYPSSFVPNFLRLNPFSLDSSPALLASTTNIDDGSSSGSSSISMVSDLLENDFFSNPPMPTKVGSETPTDRLATFGDECLAVLNNSCMNDSGLSDSDFSDASEGGHDGMYENVNDRLDVDKGSFHLWQEDGSLHLDRFLENLD